MDETIKHTVFSKKIDKYRALALIKKIITTFFLITMLIGLSYLILYPFIVKFSSAFMSVEDTYDSTVGFIPRHPTLDNIRYVLNNTDFLKAIWTTFALSVIVAVGSVISSSLIGYGLGKFKFKGSTVVTALVVLVLLIPPQTILIPMYAHFRYFLNGAIKLTDTVWPMVFLSFTSFGFRGGLYVLIMRQVYKGIPNELSEAAAVDGVGAFKTFLYVMFPLSVPMLTVVFLFSFSWQWTDTFYSSTFYSSVKLLPNIVTVLQNANNIGLGGGDYTKSILLNTVSLMCVIPLLLLFAVVQKRFVSGIESSGIVG